MNSTVNKQQLHSLILVSEFDEVKQIISKIFDSASIHNFELTQQGRQFRIIVPTEYYVPQICLKQLESNGYSVHLLHGNEQGLEIEIGENKK